MKLEKLMDLYDGFIHGARDSTIVSTVILSFLEHLGMVNWEIAVKSAVFLAGFSAYIRCLEVWNKYYPVMKGED